MQYGVLLVKFLEDVGYDGSRHFDAHAYRTEGLQRGRQISPSAACAPPDLER
ncbi:MAG: hypothetical protein WKF84_00290 [Pyrinomonadaceae bacterium]